MSKKVMSMGSRIREARIRRQLTQKDVVGEYMTRNMLSKIENGSATPSVKTLEYLAGALSLPVSYFVSEDAGEPRDFSGIEGQLSELSSLADRLVDEAPELSYIAALALCVKARVLLVADDPDGAEELLRECGAERYCPEGQAQVYLLLEECCKAREDYKAAYEYACLRMSCK